MDDDQDLEDFGNVCRLFPLPGVVFFPHSVLPLHIFEPRYRQMTEEALAGDKLISIVQLHEREGPAPAADFSPPAVHEVACLGKILQHERLPDGRFKVFLLGRKRVRLKREIPTHKLYRLAEVELLDDVACEFGAEDRRTELLSWFRRVFESQQSVDPDLSQVLESTLPLGALTDILTHGLPFPATVKQALLAERRVERRTEWLLEILQRIEQGPDPAKTSRPFPPPFSPN